MRIRGCPPLSGLPQHLRRPGQHRRVRTTCGAAAATRSTSPPSAFGSRSRRVRSICSTSAGARTGSRLSLRPTCAAKGAGIRAAVEAGAALLAVCGGYQLLGRGYRGRDGSCMPGAGLFPLETDRRRTSHDRRRAARVRARARRASDARGLREPRRSDAARPGRRAARPGCRGFRQRRRVGVRGCRVAAAIGTYLHGPLLPRNPWLADWLLARALAHATARSHLRSSRSTTSWRRQRTPSPRAAHESAAAVRRTKARQASPLRGRVGAGLCPALVTGPRGSRGRRRDRRAASGGGTVGSAGATRSPRARR